MQHTLSLGHTEAQRAIEAIEAEAQRRGKPAVIAVADAHGKAWATAKNMRGLGIDLPLDRYYTTCSIRVNPRESKMHKKLTITLDERVYEALHNVIGPRRISQFIEDLVRPHVLSADLEAGYAQMAQDEAREAEALEWAEATVGDVTDAAW